MESAAWSEPKASSNNVETEENWSDVTAAVLSMMRSVTEQRRGSEYDLQVGVSGSEMIWKSWSVIQSSTSEAHGDDRTDGSDQRRLWVLKSPEMRVCVAEGTACQGWRGDLGQGRRGPS